MKAVTAAQLSMAADGVYSVTLDEAIEAMRVTAADMSVKYKETSLSVRSCFCCFFAESLSMFDRVSRYVCVVLQEQWNLYSESLQTTVKIPLTVPAWCVSNYLVYSLDQI